MFLRLPHTLQVIYVSFSFRFINLNHTEATPSFLPSSLHLCGHEPWLSASYPNHSWALKHLWCHHCCSHLPCLPACYRGGYGLQLPLLPAGTCWCTKSHRHMARVRVSLLLSLLNKLLCHSIFMSKKTTALGAIVTSRSVAVGGWFITAQIHQGNHSHTMPFILEVPQHWGKAERGRGCRGSEPDCHNHCIFLSTARWAGQCWGPAPTRSLTLAQFLCLD